MTRKSVRNSALLALAATSAHLAAAIPWLEPRITPMGMMPIDGISPMPTKAPGKEVGGSFFDNWYNKKACIPIPDTICGYVTNNVANSLTCGQGNQCVRDGFRFGCCSESNINLCTSIYTICGNYVDTCGPACQANPRVLKCSNLAAPFCQTFTFSGGVLGYNCATVGGMTSVAWVRDIYPSGCINDGNNVVSTPPSPIIVTVTSSQGGAAPSTVIVTPPPNSAVSPPPPPPSSNPPPQSSQNSQPSATQQPTINTLFNPTVFVTIQATDNGADTAVPVSGKQTTLTFTSFPSSSSSSGNGNGIGVGQQGSTSTTSAAVQTGKSSGIGTGAIAGISIAGVAVAAAIAGAIFYFCCFARRRGSSDPHDPSPAVPAGGAAGGAGAGAYVANASEKIAMGPQDHYAPTPVTHQAYPVPTAGGYQPQGYGQQQQYPPQGGYQLYPQQPVSPTGGYEDNRYSIPQPPPPQYGVVGNVVPPNQVRQDERDGRMSPASELGDGHSREPSGGWETMGGNRVQSPELHGAEMQGRAEVDGTGVGGRSHR